MTGDVVGGARKEGYPTRGVGDEGVQGRQRGVKRPREGTENIPKTAIDWIL